MEKNIKNLEKIIKTQYNSMRDLKEHLEEAIRDLKLAYIATVKPHKGNKIRTLTNELKKIKNSVHRGYEYFYNYQDYQFFTEGTFLTRFTKPDFVDFNIYNENIKDARNFNLKALNEYYCLKEHGVIKTVNVKKLLNACKLKKYVLLKAYDNLNYKEYKLMFDGKKLKKLIDILELENEVDIFLTYTRLEHGFLRVKNKNDSLGVQMSIHNGPEIEKGFEGEDSYLTIEL